MTEYDADEIEAAIAAHLSANPPVEPDVPDQAGVSPVDWRHLSDDDAAAAWTALREWVEWFTVRYDIPPSIVPACWWKHDALVEELSALHIAHLASFASEDTGYGPIVWHEHLAQAHPRLQRAGVGCTSGHSRVKPRSWVGQIDDEEWNVWVSQAHAH